MQDDCVDAILTDPPYSSGGLHTGQRQRPPSEKYQSSDAQRRHAEFHGDNRDQRSFTLWATLWLTECYRVARNGAACMVFTDWRQLPAMTDAMQAGGWTWRGIIVWDKPTARPILGEFRRQCEYVVFGVKGKLAPAHRRCLPGVYRHSIIAHQKRMHMTEKPLPLIHDLLDVTPDDATVLDPFMGSATTGAVCLQTGRKFIGMELSSDYFQIACARLEQTAESTSAKQ
jgi:site-specific DNA-methyltransferase (adenine-specific)